jgi:putative transposase
MSYKEAVVVFYTTALCCATNTTGYARGSKKLLAMSRKKGPPFVRMNAGSPTASITKEVSNVDSESLAHSKWNCKYHIVFAPKYRRQVIYGQIKADIGQILRKLCEYKGVEIIEANACPDHIHMLVSIPPKLSVAQFMGYLKGKSSLMIFDRHANLKYKYGNRQFWCKGYYVDTVGRNKKAIQDYIKKQLQEDIISDQVSMKELTDPFTGEPVIKGKK